MKLLTTLYLKGKLWVGMLEEAFQTFQKVDAGSLHMKVEKRNSTGFLLSHNSAIVPHVVGWQYKWQQNFSQFTNT